jgi:transketolase
MPTFDRTELAPAAGVARGAYVLADGSDVILIGTGSEVQIAVAARTLLAAEGISARVVSMPSVEWFKEQDASYQEEVLPAAMRARVSVEAGITPPWRIFVGDAGESVGIDHYGASAAEAVLYKEFGITAEAVAAAAKASIANAQS